MADASDWPTYLVEHYWPGVTEAEFRRWAGRVAASAERLAQAGAPIRFMHSTLVPEDASAFCVLAAASPELVERAYAAAGVTFERLVEAVESEARPGRDIPVPIGSEAGPRTRATRARWNTAHQARGHGHGGTTEVKRP